MTRSVDHNVLELVSTQDDVLLKSHHGYFEKELKKLPAEKLWEIIVELLLPYNHDVPDQTKMSYEQILELGVFLKETDEMFRNLEQIAILQSGLDKASNLGPNDANGKA
ncbi:MAG TPA: hypothetical protein VJ571_01795 [Candidatus Nitrosotalea sp.]|nr:hypothetical protein [Candidatus Nitrosotalea sp.]